MVIVISNFVSRYSTLKFDDVVGAILSEKMGWKISNETSGNALNAKTKGKKWK